MPIPSAAARAVLLACLALAAGCAEERALMEPASGRAAPDFALPDLEGRTWRLSEHRGRALLINFWATWCAPCREEIPMLMELEQRRPEVRVIGIALDTADAVRAFAKELGIGYPLLFDDARGSTMRRYGNRLGALPFTVVAGRDGMVGYVRLGVLDPAELDTAVAALL